MSWLGDLADDIGEAFSDGAAAVSNAASEFADNVEDTWEDFTDDVSDTWNDAMDTAKNAFKNGNYVQGIIATLGGIGAGILGTIGAFSDFGLNISADVLVFGSSLGGIATGTLTRVGVIVITGGYGSGTARDLGELITEGSRMFVEWGADGLRLSGDLLERAIDISATVLLAGTDLMRCFIGSFGRPGYAGYKPQGFNAINHIFVILLENRSFDHMLGALPGVNGLATGNYSNFYRAQDRPPMKVENKAGKDASFSLKVDTPHEFPDVHEQLFWDHTKGPTYVGAVESASPSGAVLMGGFAMQYFRTIQKERAEEVWDHRNETDWVSKLPESDDPQEAMNAFTPKRLPILNTLAAEFAVCERWHSSLPGPTLPNRQFVHAATSGGMADSPSTPSLIWAMTVGGFEYENGTVFDRLDANCIDWHVYAGDATPLVMTLKGMATDGAPSGWSRIGNFVDLLQDLSDAENDDFPHYVFIEPDYGSFWSDFKGGDSQHPLDSTIGGETLLKFIYEALRQSRIWENSALVITYDEHGGFFDHVPPPAATPPGDSRDYESWSESEMAKQFQFDRLGVRVPAIIVSPWVARGTVDKTIYDHSSVIATLAKCFGFKSLTERDKSANTFDGVFTNTLRKDCLLTLPTPVG